MAASGVRVAVVTGGNKGIGFQIVRKLCKALPKGSTVYLTARDPERGNKAVQEIAAENPAVTPVFHKLDITEKSDAETLKSHLEREHGGIDILINNAGFAFKSAATEPVDVQAKETLAINYYGTLNVCEALVPLLRPGARMVNVGSMAGRTDKYSAELRNTFHDSKLTIEELTELVEKFKADTRAGDHTKKGWPNTTYGVSKAAVHSLTRIYARDIASIVKDAAGITINAICPGWCKSDMAGYDRPPRTAEQGAEVAVKPALHGPDGPTSSFFTSDSVESLDKV